MRSQAATSNREPIHRFGTLDNHLPLDALCREIERSVLDTLGVRDLPARLAPVDARLT